MTTYADLQQAIIEDTHRPDLALLVPRFIRECEGLIRRDLVAFLLTTTLTDTERAAADSPIYNLPTGVLIIRRIAPQDAHATEVQRINLGSIGRFSVSGRVAVYAEAGDQTIEFRGTPGATAIFDLNFYGIPAPLVNDLDTNTLLENHETLYKAGAMFFLYQHTQDRELAADAQDIFFGVITTLNDQVARKIGGAKIAQSYNFSGGSSY